MKTNHANRVPPSHFFFYGLDGRHRLTVAPILFAETAQIRCCPTLSGNAFSPRAQIWNLETELGIAFAFRERGGVSRIAHGVCSYPIPQILSIGEPQIMNKHKYAHGPFPQSNSAAILVCGLGTVSSARLQLGLGRLERMWGGGR